MDTARNEGEANKTYRIIGDCRGGDVSTGCPKKMSFSGKTAITTFKLIQNAKVGGVLESSGYLLHHGH